MTYLSPATGATLSADTGNTTSSVWYEMINSSYNTDSVLNGSVLHYGSTRAQLAADDTTERFFTHIIGGATNTDVRNIRDLTYIST